MFIAGLRLSGKLRGSIDNYSCTGQLEGRMSKVDLYKTLPRFLGGLTLGIVARKNLKRTRGGYVRFQAYKISCSL